MVFPSSDADPRPECRVYAGNGRRGSLLQPYEQHRSRPYRLFPAQADLFHGEGRAFQKRFRRVGPPLPRGVSHPPGQRRYGRHQPVAPAPKGRRRPRRFHRGTRSKDGNLLRPKPGAAMLAASCHAPILPCCITAKGGGPSRLFRRVVITYGRLIPPEALGIEKGTPSELRAASLFVMDRIRELRETGLKEFR